MPSINRYNDLMIKRIIIGFLSLGVALIILTTPGETASFSAAGLNFTKKVKSLKEIRQQDVVTQSLDFSCGAAGLSTLLNFYLNDPVGETEIINDLLGMVPLEKVRERHGFSLYDLKKYAESKGYKVTGYKMDLEFLKELGKPIIVPIKFKNYRHFVVVKGVIGDRVFIADPAVGNMTIKDTKFMALWTKGIGFLVEHPEAEGRNAEDYRLKVAQNDLRLTDYRTLPGFADITRVRTSIFTNEW